MPSGPPLVHVLAAGGTPPARAHELLARQFHLIELPAPTSAAALGRSLSSLGVDEFNLLASSNACAAALGLALEAPERVKALVLESPTALGDDHADLARRLADVAAPTLVLFGTGDGFDVQATGRVYAEAIPNAHLAFVYGADHAIARERPEAFAEVVADFLERHEAFVINRTPTVIHP